MLTAEQAKELERLQRLCVRLIFGWEKSYATLLAENHLESLSKRRTGMCPNFALKCTEHDTFNSWFPLEPAKEHDLRMTRKYAIPSHIAFLAIYRLERHNQYNGNTFLYQNC